MSLPLSTFGMMVFRNLQTRMNLIFSKYTVQRTITRLRMRTQERYYFNTITNSSYNLHRKLNFGASQVVDD